MRMLAGTSGYSYKAWLGAFYPRDLRADEMLGYYAQRFSTVEINNTFYRMPAPSMLAQWCGQVAHDFVFTLKAPRRITHEHRLRDAEPQVAEFVRRAGGLGGRLGAILFQLPHFLRKDLPRLRDFMAVLPPGPRVAFEFRHASWQDDAVLEALRSHGAMLGVSDDGEGEARLEVTSDCAYLRLRRTRYEDAELRGWAERIAASGAATTYVYFMHEDDALCAGFAQRLNGFWAEMQSSG